MTDQEISDQIQGLRKLMTAASDCYIGQVSVFTGEIERLRKICTHSRNRFEMGTPYDPSGHVCEFCGEECD